MMIPCDYIPSPNFTSIFEIIKTKSELVTLMNDNESIEKKAVD